jgi:hypothetical protein
LRHHRSDFLLLNRKHGGKSGKVAAHHGLSLTTSVRDFHPQAYIIKVKHSTRTGPFSDPDEKIVTRSWLFRAIMKERQARKTMMDGRNPGTTAAFIRFSGLQYGG